MHYCIGLCYWFLSRWRVGVLRILPPTFNLSCNKLGCCRLWKVLQQNLYWLVCVLLAKANLFCSKWRTTYRVYIAWLPRNFIQLEVSILCFHYHALKNKNSNQLTQKVQNLGNKRDEYTLKRLAKNQVCAMFHMRDIRKNVPKYEDAMLVSPGGVQIQQKHLFLSFSSNASVHRLMNS